MILRDPVHGLVSFEAAEETIIPALLDTREVQRLRRIRQLGVTSLAFPGAEHSRFAHALGAAFVMKQLLVRLRALHGTLPPELRVNEGHARAALAAALLHDVGHGPLSHLFEDAIPGIPHHESWTERIVTDPSTEVHQVLVGFDPALPGQVASLVRGEYPLAYLARAVSGTFDVDRCDYLLRDAHATGVRYGLYDLDWLLRSLRFTPVQRSAREGEAPGLASGRVSDREAPGLAIDGAKGLPAIEAFILARLFMFQQIYLHKATRSAEWMIRALLARAAKVLSRGGELPGVPAAFASAARSATISLGDYLELDDGVLWGALRAWEGAGQVDAPLADVAARIRRRALFKTLELFGDQAKVPGRDDALARARDVARRRGLDPELYVGLDVAEDVPFDEGDELVVVYAKGPARPLREVSFLLGRLAGQPLTRTRLVVAPEVRDEVIRAVVR